jgi:hypothetical protein
VRFWDSSAIVPLLAEEPASRACREVLRRDGAQVVWWLTRTEALSALCRRQRDGALTRAELGRAAQRLEKLAARWAEVEPIPAVREAAERLLRLHRLRAADALQLGAALVAADDRPRGRPFVSLDDVLTEAAEREGFTAVVPVG